MRRHAALLLVGLAACGDNDAPRFGPVTIIDAAPAANSPVSHAVVTFHADGAAGFTCSLDGAAPSACASPAAFDVADGSHQLAIVAIGADRLTGEPAIARFAVDTVAPDTVITVGPGLVETTGAASFRFAAASDAEAVRFECALDAAGFTPCTSPAALTAGEGEHRFRVRAIDAAGNVDGSPAELAWTVDTEGPPLELLTRPANPSNAATPAFTFRSDDVGATFECRLDGVAAFAPCTSPFTAPALGDGAQTFRLRATDPAHHTTTLIYGWLVDRTAPTVVFTGGPLGPTPTATPTFTFSASPDAPIVECRTDGAAFAPCTSPATTATLAQGGHTFAVRVADLAGNTASVSRLFTVDTVVPTVAITAGPSGPTNVVRPTWTFTTTDAPTVIECALDGAAPAPCTTSFTPAADLGEATHTFAVRVADAAGNAGTDGRTIAVDLHAPVVTITGGPTGTTFDTTPTFDFAIAGGFTAARCRIDTGAFAPCSASFTPAPLGGGPHTFEIAADDDAGNTGAATRPFTVDASAPTVAITDAPPASTNDATPTFTFTTGATAATVECRVDGGPFAACASPITVAPALTEASHTFEVQACTPAPACASDARTFTVDLTAPLLAITAGPADPTPTALDRPAFAFDASDATVVTCRITDAASPDPAFVACAATFTPAGPLADGAHVFEVRAADAAGNPTTRTRAFTVDTLAPVIAIQAPLIPARTSDVRPRVVFAVIDVGAATATCRVDTGPAVACDGAAGFRAAADLGEGPHAYHLVATDAAGHPGTADVGFTVDLTPPSVTITGGPADPTTDDTPTFTFMISADATRARCAMDTGEVIDPCTTGVTFPPIAPGARTFTVTAYDDASPGNPASATFAFELEDCSLGCSTCGNTLVDAGEVCDGTNLGGATCTSLGHAPGTLACGAACAAFDLTGCDGGFVGANAGLTATTVCANGLSMNSNAQYVAACTEDQGVWKLPLTGATAGTWINLNGVTAGQQVVNLHGHTVYAQSDVPFVLFYTDAAATTGLNAYRSNSFASATAASMTWPTSQQGQAALATAGAPIQVYAARGASSTNSIWGGWHQTLGAIVQHGSNNPTATINVVAPGATGTVTSVAAPCCGAGGTVLPSTDVNVAVYGRKPDGTPGTGGGIYWACDLSGTAGGNFVAHDSGLSAADKSLVFALTPDNSSFNAGSRTCPQTGLPVFGFAMTWYAALRGGGQVYKTTDAGVTWVQRNTGLPAGAEVFAVAIDCSGGAPGTATCVDPNVLYAATSAGLYTSVDGGGHWSVDGLEGRAVRSLLLLPHAVGTRVPILAAADDAVRVYQRP